MFLLAKNNLLYYLIGTNNSKQIITAFPNKIDIININSIPSQQIIPIKKQRKQ